MEVPVDLSMKESETSKSEEPTIVYVKNFYENDHILAKGRLINTSLFEGLVKKLPKHLDKTSLLKNKIKLYKDKFVDLRIMLTQSNNEVHFDLYLVPSQEIKDIKLTESTSLTSI